MPIVLQLRDCVLLLAGRRRRINVPEYVQLPAGLRDERGLHPPAVPGMPLPGQSLRRRPRLALLGAVLGASSDQPHPRVESGIDQVDDQVRATDQQRAEENAAHDHRDVEPLRRLQRLPADPRPTKDVLDQRQAG